MLLTGVRPPQARSPILAGQLPTAPSQHTRGFRRTQTRSCHASRLCRPTTSPIAAVDRRSTERPTGRRCMTRTGSTTCRGRVWVRAASAMYRRTAARPWRPRGPFAS
jgi:hypothetical protein